MLNMDAPNDGSRMQGMRLGAALLRHCIIDDVTVVIPEVRAELRLRMKPHKLSKERQEEIDLL